MDIVRLTSLLILVTCSQGCSMYYSGLRTLVCEPLHYCAPKDNCFAIIRNRITAEAVWRDVVRATPEVDYSDDYADGFRDGYADYLYAGGTGAPPPLPPRRYWRKYYQSPEGHQQILDWYAGFSHGASMAEASGQRELITVPSAVFVPQSADARFQTPHPPGRGPSPDVEGIPPPAAEPLSPTRPPQMPVDAARAAEQWPVTLPTTQTTNPVQNLAAAPLDWPAPMRGQPPAEPAGTLAFP